MNGDKLLSRARRGDAVALGNLYDAEGCYAYRIALYLLGDESDACEAVEVAFARVLQQEWAGPRGRVRLLLVEAVHRHATEILQRRQRPVPRAAGTLEAVRAEHQQIVAYCVLAGLTVTEATAIIRLNPDTVHWRLGVALRSAAHERARAHGSRSVLSEVMASGPRNGGTLELIKPRHGQFDIERTIVGAEQMTADADRIASARDQATSDRDRASSGSDQEAADRDQATADREAPATNNGGISSDASHRERDKTRAQRAGTRSARERDATIRANTTVERIGAAEQRDQAARSRDLECNARDLAAAARDRLITAREERSGVDGASTASARERAAADRRRAANDRQRAALDRHCARIDRERLRVALAESHLDDLTGSYQGTRENRALQAEIERVRLCDGSLTLAFIGIGGLTAVSQHRNAPAGDELLIEVVACIRAHLRPYDPVIRYPGDEFVCALANVGVNDARQRFDNLEATIEQAHPGLSFSAGFADLGDGETLDELLERGGSALSAAKREGSMGRSRD